MTIKEFSQKHHLDFGNNELEEELFFTLLDKIYLELTPEQAVEMIKDLFIFGDDVYNELAERTQKRVEQIKSLFDEQTEDVNKDFDA